MSTRAESERDDALRLLWQAQAERDEAQRKYEALAAEVRPWVRQSDHGHIYLNSPLLRAEESVALWALLKEKQS